jgi:hypothetical protein
MILFSQIDQRLGGGHGRTAVVQYLTNEVTSYLNGSYASEAVRRDMFSAASELAYLAGWMAFDNDEHSPAQRYFAAFGARSARDNPEWPKVGIFGHRNMRRVNWLGVSRTRLLRVDDLDLHVAELDAVDGTPVLDIKPWFAEFGPRGEIRQAPWSTEMLKDYF